MKKRDLIDTVQRIAREAWLNETSQDPAAVTKQIARLLRAATSLRKVGLDLTQADDQAERQKLSAREERLKTQIVTACEKLSVEVAGWGEDVRGCPVFLKLPGAHKDALATNGFSSTGWGIG